MRLDNADHNEYLMKVKGFAIYLILNIIDYILGMIKQTCRISSKLSKDVWLCSVNL